jgi:hypothetical protein
LFQVKIGNYGRGNSFVLLKTTFTVFLQIPTTEDRKMLAIKKSKLQLWVYCLTIIISAIGGLSAAIKSTTGTIDFDVNRNGITELKLSTTGLAIGPNLSAATNLHVQGSAIITNDLVVGGMTSGNATFYLNGTFGLNTQTVTSSVTLGDSSSVCLADTISNDITVTLPYAGNVSGRMYTIKKSSTSNALILSGGNSTIDGFAAITYSSGNNVAVKVISDGSQWFIISTQGSTNSGSGSSLVSWTPADTSTSLWLDASDNTTITQDAGGNVSQWNDKSGNNRHVSEATNMPTYSATGLGGNATIIFDGTNDQLMSTSLDIARNISSLFIILVFQRTGGDGTYGTVFTATRNGATNSRASVFAGATNFEVGGRRTDADGYQNINQAYAVSNVNLGAAHFDYANASIYNGISAEYASSSFQTSGNTSDTDSQVSGLGSNGAGGELYGGKISEMIVFSNQDIYTSYGTRLRLEGYLAHKWGIESSLPDAHPYKSSAPTK